MCALMSVAENNSKSECELPKNPCFVVLAYPGSRNCVVFVFRCVFSPFLHISVKSLWGLGSIRASG